ncbi:Mlp family lipoprotein (plasmid) [Borrelia parkeri]|uniref:Mlp family lipoprotein n=1 Tax=Borrelia parkeri TaxID=141 RepID=UPI001FF49E6E|nr:Mlp family lipoprotein [Borrelia parkeri]UPA11049.1 Mlp family lipoprotein [Borrelia parkeri]UPA11086.1 Mlp family lipoprotein [Borrelia parkeri]UPA11143.1 Mlp family lipoprotein [Borrelia parkeri]UPA11179.1 Mlp family lipoprotein [Borrelia parkeri]
MNKINFILVLALLISSCEYEHRNATPKSRVKRNLEEQEEVQKTPEEVLREKLNETQKTNLDFLKQALGNDDLFNKFLNHDESKIKEALEHINTELEKCNGNDGGKSTFKTVVQGYFSKMDESTLNGFKEGATSTCQVGAGG